MQPASPSPSSPSAVGSPADSPASALSAGFSPSPLNTAPSSPLDDASVVSDVSGESFLNRLKELHCGPLFGSSSEESEEGDSEGLRAARPPSPTPSVSGLFDDDSDEETEPVGGLNRLRRGTDSGDWHPYTLPPVAFRAALYHLGDPGLASTAIELWLDFKRENPDTVDGVSLAEATEFFCVLQRSVFLLDYDLLFQSPLDGSYTNVELFQTFVQTLREGVYLTSIGDGLVGHCVVVLAKGPDTAVSVLDGVEPPVTPEPLTNLEYLDKVKWMGLMKLNPGYHYLRGKRKSRPNRKKARRERRSSRSCKGCNAGIHVDSRAPFTLDFAVHLLRRFLLLDASKSAVRSGTCERFSIGFQVGFSSPTHSTRNWVRRFCIRLLRSLWMSCPTVPSARTTSWGFDIRVASLYGFKEPVLKTG
ncbi:hypothetical protein P3T76_010160 [Phytophthora citrophthora]|uniref:Uncharacterized protein n=1 Tax=Phytophthora citrophthora TaxID=4793 RepID=A0AAD9LHM5_9STRA|nr:hypothetical protein P3T76_010160 [Phytophthora citrophthora]